ncbi:methionyl-tRNA formyltransferase [Levilactobacillus namurensis DSM 19117]|uniref:Methionyl-tRNA formyltransferase n=1 Tax=Levilactobacillus namurensis DSM 19117 TaxID=1423773 RepID=A0A0R1K9J9_9LACO|nr:methionyl-tRNA formyltransferase [Levilactobacillus namurensis]KRK77172.1 methionyl-tRNA formyltransferase [Levilactobacillus namurensis DSM 19117]GEO73381.1 methionyl-tRNA formyltransferase [Levilactobacillus namurensis]
MTSVIFMGTPEFSAPILQSLIDHDYQVLAVVTQPDRRVGRKHVLTASPVKQVAVANNIEVLQPEKIGGSPEMARAIALAPDLIVTAAFGQFLPTKLLKAAKVAAVNVHASLLPKYRGGAPVHYAIMNGDRETGVSIMFMEKKMDAGDVLAQRAIPITDQDDVGSMFDKLSLLGRDLLLDTLPKLLAGEITPVKQDEQRVTFAPTIKSDEERIDLTMSAHMIDCKVRALRPFPTAHIYLNGVRTKLWQVTVLDQTTDLQPGELVSRDKHHLAIATGEHGVLQIDELQPAGKPKLSITDFLNGSTDALQVGEQVAE